MKIQGNTILITGGGSGIGLGLAKEFKKRGNEVIVAGRSAEKLAAAAKLGLHTHSVDMTDAASITRMASALAAEFPRLNCVIHNAGVMMNENLQLPDRGVRAQTVATNLLGPMILTEALLPLFLKQPSATIMTVSSGLAYAPLALTPTYSATKAAIHSYTQSLRWQLRETKVQVMELVPPYVATHLMGDRQAEDPNAMPLADFIREVFSILERDPNAREILVERVKAQRNSADGGAEKHEQFFLALNERMWASRKAEFPR